MDQFADLEEKCLLKDRKCPLLEELQRLREECEKLEELSQIDSLTGLYNFRYLLKALEVEMERTRRTGLPTGLVMIDLDHFKRINDTYGHDSGNKALRWTSKIWRGNIRRIDIPCRYGGEEFVIILPGTRLPQTVHTAKRLQTVIAESSLEFDGEAVRMTASFGVDSYRGEGNLSVEGFIKRADHFLIQAKTNGRNRVFYDEAKMAEEITEVTDKEREALLGTTRTGES